MFNSEDYRSFDSLINPPSCWSQGIAAVQAFQLDFAESAELICAAAFIADSILWDELKAARVFDRLPPNCVPWQDKANWFHRALWECRAANIAAPRVDHFIRELGRIADQADRDNVAGAIKEVKT